MMLGAGSAKALGGLYGLSACPNNADCATPQLPYSGPQITGNLPPGYQIVGACDQNTGAPTAGPSTYSYVMNGSNFQCLSPTQLQQLMRPAQPASPAVFVSNDPVVPQSSTPTGSTGPGIINNPIAGGASNIGQPAAPVSTDMMLGSFDVTSFLSQYGIWIAVGVGGLLLVTSMSK